MGNQINLFQLSIEKIIMALVMTFVIINAEIDLSVGSMMGLSACAFGWLFMQGRAAGSGHRDLSGDRAGGRGVQRLVHHQGRPAVAGRDAGHADRVSRAGAGAGRGSRDQRFPDWFDALGQQGLIGPVPFALIAFVVLFVVLYVVLERSGFGRMTYVIGSNRDVAEYAGIDTGRHKMVIFMASGLVAAFAGLLFAARVGAVRGDVGNGFELDVITIVLLGGVSIFGGKGTLVGTLLAILIVLNLRNGMGCWTSPGICRPGSSAFC